MHKLFHKVKFYPSADNFTQALLVMLVTNIMSVLNKIRVAIHSFYMYGLFLDQPSNPPVESLFLTSHR